MNLVLASASPRRLELLRGAGIECRVVPAHVDETVSPDEPPRAVAERLALAKAAAVAEQFPTDVVLGADTVVVLGRCVLGKPSSLAEARDMLARLSGQWHDVLTGVVLLRLSPPHRHGWVCRTEVRFKSLDPNTIRLYTETVEVLDKAGAYGIQERGDMLVDEVRGLVSNVIGLPVEEVCDRLATFGRPQARRSEGS